MRLHGCYWLVGWLCDDGLAVCVCVRLDGRVFVCVAGLVAVSFLFGGFGIRWLGVWWSHVLWLCVRLTAWLVTTLPVV